MFKLLTLMSFMSILWWRNSIIMMLLSLELMILTLLTILMLSTPSTNPMNMFIMLSLMVAASSIGLSLLVVSSQYHNSSSSLFIWTLTFAKNNYPSLTYYN